MYGQGHKNRFPEEPSYLIHFIFHVWFISLLWTRRSNTSKYVYLRSIKRFGLGLISACFDENISTKREDALHQLKLYPYILWVDEFIKIQDCPTSY